MGSDRIHSRVLKEIAGVTPHDHSEQFTKDAGSLGISLLIRVSQL